MPTRPKPYRPPTPARSDPRASAAIRGYDRKWRTLSAAFIADNPLCRLCDEAGRLTPAVLVDHIIPHQDGGARLDRANLQSLCQSCHNRKTADDVRKRSAPA